jgi:hypothetical protein
MKRLAGLLLGVGLCGAVAAATPPSRMMANVYLLAEAGAMLDICIASPAFRELPAEGARELQGLDRRLMDLVRSIGTHYGEEGLDGVFAATKHRIASDPRLKFHVKNNYQYCGESLVGQLKTYVGENEALLGGFFREQGVKGPAARGK